MDSPYNTHGLELSRWRPPQQTHRFWAGDRHVGSFLLAYDMEDLSDAEFERRHGFSREVLKQVEQKQLDEKNALEYGARMRGGYAFVEQEKAAKFLEKQKAEEARSEKMRERARWMWLLDPGSGETQPVEIMMDTGSDVNIMTEGMAKDYNLEMLGLPRPETFDLPVGEVTCRYRVQVSWMGARDRYGTTEFYVVPSEDARIKKPLLGFESIQEIQDSLLMECPRKAIAYTAMKKKTPQDEMRTKQAREQALADRTKLAREKTTYQESRGEKRREKGSSSNAKDKS